VKARRNEGIEPGKLRLELQTNLEALLSVFMSMVAGARDKSGG
jgi:hypothetical protein